VSIGNEQKRVSLDAQSPSDYADNVVKQRSGIVAREQDDEPGDNDGDDGGTDTDHDKKGKGNPCGPVEPVPEPETLLLLATGLAVAALEVKRRSRVPVFVSARR